MYISYAFMGSKSFINYFCPFLVPKNSQKVYISWVHIDRYECIMKPMVYTS